MEYKTYVDLKDNIKYGMFINKKYKHTLKEYEFKSVHRCFYQNVPLLVFVPVTAQYMFTTHIHPIDSKLRTFILN